MLSLLERRLRSPVLAACGRRIALKAAQKMGRPQENFREVMSLPRHYIALPLLKESQVPCACKEPLALSHSHSLP